MNAADRTLHYIVCMADTDANGVVYHARYIEMAERARNRLMNLAGFTFSTLAQQYQVMLIVHRVEAVYHSPAVLDDELKLRARLIKCQHSRSIWVTDVIRGEELLASVTIEIVTSHVSTRQLTRHPQQFVDRLTSFLEAAPAAGSHKRPAVGSALSVPTEAL